MASIDTFPLLASKKQQIVTDKSYLAKAAKELAKKAGGINEEGEMLLCQCGFGKDEGEMVQCFCCSTWQHLHCYGYTCGDDPRLPKEHVCHWCLLGKSDVGNYKALQELAIQRRAIYSVSKSGMRTKTDLQTFLGIDQKQASGLHAMIKSDFVTQAAKSHKPGYRATGKALFVPVHGSSAVRKLLETYFDPMTHISHHYGPPPAAGLVEKHIQINQRLLTALATDLPPPATPHNSSLRSTAASDDGRTPDVGSTPVSSASAYATLESWEPVPTSETLRGTPTHNAHRQTLTNKRRLNLDEVEARTAKRVTTPTQSPPQFTSFRSLKIIDADGNLSSSPAQYK